MTFRERMEKGLVVFDGAMGTMLQEYLALGELPEKLNLTHPEAVQAVHRAYLDAGADVVETNTLNANRLKVEKAGHTVDEVILAAVICAKDAVAASGKEGYVALSMGSLGVMIEPLGDLGFDEAYDIYAEMARAGERAGADLVLIETVSDLHEMKAAIMAAKRETSLPVAATLTFFANGKLLTGADVRTSVAVVEALGADIVGLNCGLGPKQMIGLMGELAAAASVPILINPNAGLPKLVDGKSVFSVGPEVFAGDDAALVYLGARLIGGCCGTTPDHIRALCDRLAGVEASPVSAKNRAVIASGSKCVEFEGEPVAIADISGDDPDEMVDAALEAEADVLMVAYSPLAEAVAALQEMILKPMYLVARTPGEAEAALRIYNGKPLVGIAGEGNLEEYIRVAREGGAALAVSSGALCARAAEALGAANVFVDCGKDARLSEKLSGDGVRTILRGEGVAAVRVADD